MGISIVPIIVWLVVAFVFLILEAVADKYFLPFAIGGGVSAIASLFNLAIVPQIIIFVVVTALCYLLFKPSGRRGKDKDARKKTGRAEDFDDFD